MEMIFWYNFQSMLHTHFLESNWEALCPNIISLDTQCSNNVYCIVQTSQHRKQDWVWTIISRLLNIRNKWLEKTIMKANTLFTFDISFFEGPEKKLSPWTLTLSLFFQKVSNFRTSNGKCTAVNLRLKYLTDNPLFPSSVSP